jgi:hypothetical protein
MAVATRTSKRPATRVNKPVTGEVDLPDGAGTRYEQIPASKLDIDPRVQRDHINLTKLNKMRDEYNPLALGTLVVSERADGSMVILDGQHRWTLAREMAGEGHDIEMDCRVHTGLTLEDEARLFVDLNRQQAASALDLHKARCTQKEPVALAITKAVASQGWTIGVGAGRVSAVKVLESIYYMGEEWQDGYGPTLISNTLFVLTETWGKERPKVVSQSILRAVAEFLLAVEIWMVARDKPDHFSYDGLIDAMVKTFKGGPEGWINAEKIQAQGQGISVREALRRSMHRAYNKVNRSGRLPAGVVEF